MMVDGTPVQPGDWLSSWVWLGGLNYSMSVKSQHNDITLFRVLKVNRVTLDVDYHGARKRVRFERLVSPHRVSPADAADW